MGTVGSTREEDHSLSQHAEQSIFSQLKALEYYFEWKIGLCFSRDEEKGI